MPLGLAVLLAVFGAAALIFSAFGWLGGPGASGKDKKKPRTAAAAAGAFFLLAALVYIVLTLIFLNAV